MPTNSMMTFAIYLSAIFFFGMVCCAVLICYKFFRDSRERLKEKYCIELLHAYLNDQDSERSLTSLQQFMTDHPISACFGLVRLLENLNQDQILQYRKELDRLGISKAVNTALSSSFNKNKAIALEAIGLMKLTTDQSVLRAYLHNPDLAPFAIEALARIQGKEALPDMLHCYQQQLLSNSQILTALVQLDPQELHKLIHSTNMPAIPAELSSYLKTT